ncbi:NAD(P)/FAD-dependent oxidoreductase [Streptomyces sp. NPDC050560]|uniref:NAD(P)/FAD-dependent oxidoreductase n=1 Tax=Streptomyces sp. NPDC050560 TaxID=3365630 RepID=UPI00378D8D8E
MAPRAPRRIVVVGASLAGLRAAEALRRQGYDGHLTLVGAERHFPPYDRPPLSKAVLTGAEAESARLRAAPGLDAELILATHATALDPAAATLTLDSGRALTYDGLVIATGVAPRRPAVLRGGQGLPPVFVLRTVEDALALRRALRASPRVAVVGAGFVGCEIASSCRALGLDVTLVESAATPLERALGPRLGARLATLHRDHGTTLRTGAAVASVEPYGLALADGGRVPADVVVAAVGSVPRTAWLAGSGLDTTDGVLLDATCTALGADGIVAAGDVARWYNPRYGVAMRVEHWSNAVEQAEAAARALLLGRAAAPGFTAVPYFWSDQYGTKVQYAGRPTGTAHLVEGSPEERRFVAVHTDPSGRMSGVLCVNSPARLGRYRRGVARGLPLDAPRTSTEGSPCRM